MRNRTLTALLAISVLLALSVTAWCDDSQLTVVQDESSMEKVIERYLTDVHKLVIVEKTSATDKATCIWGFPSRATRCPSSGWT